MESYNLEGPYFRVVFGFIGITDLTIIHAGGSNKVAQGEVTESVFLEKFIHQVDLAASK
jgi:FMN-dependent NADH-azoreductase